MKTTYFANKVIDDNKNSMFLALFEGNPADNGAEVTQTTSRAAIALTAALNGSSSNSSSIDFVVDSSNSNPKVAKYWGVYDAASAGNLLYYFPIGYNVLCELGATISISAGSLILKEL